MNTASRRIGVYRLAGLEHLRDVPPVHADLMDRPVGAVRHRWTKVVFRNPTNSSSGQHLPAAHREVPVPDPETQAADTAVHGKTLNGESREDEIRLGATHEAGRRHPASGVTTEQQVRPERPEIAGPTYNPGFVIGRCRIIWAAGIASRFLGFLQTEIDIGGLEAGQLNLEVEIDQRLELDGENFPIPPRLLSQAIVREDVRTLRRLGEVGELHGRHHLKTEQFCGGDPSVSGDDPALSVDQDRITEAELLNAPGNLPDLFAGVSSCITRIGSKRFDRKHLD